MQTLEAKMAHATKRVHWYWWPFIALWRLLATIVELTGRFIAIVLGLVLMLVGFVVSLTIVGAIVGIPLIIIGFMLAIRGIF
jgi:hypothetical protein